MLLATVASTANPAASPIDWIGISIQVIQAIAAVGATIAALYAASAARDSANAARDTVRESHEDRSISLRHSYYRSLVADPAFIALENFKSDATSLLKEGGENFDKLKQEDPPASALDSHIKRLIDNYGSLIRHLGLSIYPGVDAWGNQALKVTLVDQISEAEDKISEEMLKLHQEEGSVDFDLFVREHVSSLMRSVMEQDPGILQERSNGN